MVRSILRNRSPNRPPIASSTAYGSRSRCTTISTRTPLTMRSVVCSATCSAKSNEPFWQQAYTQLLTFVISRAPDHGRTRNRCRSLRGSDSAQAFDLVGPLGDPHMEHPYSVMPGHWTRCERDHRRARRRDRCAERSISLPADRRVVSCCEAIQTLWLRWLSGYVGGERAALRVVRVPSEGPGAPPAADPRIHHHDAEPRTHAEPGSRSARD